MEGPGQNTTASASPEAGQALTPYLIADMLGASGDARGGGGRTSPELDVRMLLELAERLRNVDAVGNQSP